jgi:hypothetical protein
MDRQDERDGLLDIVEYPPAETDGGPDAEPDGASGPDSWWEDSQSQDLEDGATEPDGASGPDSLADVVEPLEDEVSEPLGAPPLHTAWWTPASISPSASLAASLPSASNTLSTILLLSGKP